MGKTQKSILVAGWASDKLAVAYNGIDFDAVQIAGTVAEALQRLQCAEIRERMGLAGQQRVRTEFTIRRQADDFLKCINRVVGD